MIDASSCAECDATARSVFIGGPTAWPKSFEKDTPLGAALTYPSRNYSAAHKTLMSSWRLFLGRCLGSGRPAAVSFMSERKGRRWKHDTAWVAPAGNHLVSRRTNGDDPDAPRLADVRVAVRKGLCREVPQQVTDEGDF